jgi:ABC-type multidrug transport system ATPase subunit
MRHFGKAFNESRIGRDAEPDRRDDAMLGRPVPAERDAALARVGAIVEEPRFHRYLTGRENLAVIATVCGTASRQATKVADLQVLQAV